MSDAGSTGDSASSHGDRSPRKDEMRKESKRPKRPQNHLLDEDVDMIDVSYTKSISHNRTEETTPIQTLPSFPLPVVPDAPPMSVLALQGLDQALLDAEFVDPATMSPVTMEDQDPATGLSLKTRRRLKEIGIEEFFAGMTFHMSVVFD